MKDINFLAHEPLLDKFRALRAYERKIKKAKAKKAFHAVDRLEERKPRYGLDHLVKERYPSFGDALRDFDDPLTLTHLFAMLPADKRHGIPAELVTRSRALALEFQAWVTKTHALRKAFISVKGIYYQALVHGQEVTWLTPHALHQTLPEDVDYRVMLTFLEFYLAMMGFVNYKLYHDRGLRYPPQLDTRLEDNAAGIVAVIHDLADTVSKVRRGQAVTAAKRGDAQAAATEARMKTLDFAAIGGGGGDDEEDEAERRDADDDTREARSDEETDTETRSNDEAMEDAIAEAAGLDPAQREDAKTCASLFKGLVFFLNREAPRDAMVFVIRAFGGEVCWDGEGSPYDERDGGVTHHVCDRPMSKDAMRPQREYVQPQWVVDCANWRVLIPTKEYAPGVPPPPHLSPFVDAEDEGYTPDYQQTLMRLRAQGFACPIGGGRPLSSYVALMSGAKFVWSPRGHGWSNHRDWEALVAGAVPVLDHHASFEALYRELPSVHVRDWANVTPAFLEAEWARIEREGARRHLARRRAWKCGRGVFPSRDDEEEEK